MKNLASIVLILASIYSVNAFGQKSQILIARNALGKLKVAITEKKDINSQFVPIKEGLKAITSAEKDRRTKDWAETWAIKSYLNSYASLISTEDSDAQKYYTAALEAVKQAQKLDRYDDNSGLIKASEHNILIRQQKIGTNFFENNEFEKAYDNLSLVSNKFPADTSLALNTAISALNIQNYNNAMVYFNRAVENGIKSPAVYQRMAQIYTAKFDDDSALKTLENGMALNPSNNGLLNDYINLLIDKGNNNKALDLLTAKLENDKDNKLLLYLYGYLQQSKNNNDKAISAYNMALQKDPNYFDAMYQLGLAFIEDANTALKSTDQKQAQKYNSLMNRAEVALERANEIDPNNTNAVKLLVEIYTKKNELDKVQTLKSKLREF